ncbi:MAG: efflux RND transporter periplasmic adaptor subunit [Burkholderiales bacterium]|nr:efflux RND transporter periplasmic adaptor subunit [Burkholderiales bacterium]
MHHKRSNLGPLWATLCVAIGLAGCQRGAGNAPSDAAPGTAPGASAPRAVQTVSVFTAQQRDVPVTVEAAGTVVALESVDLRPQVAGTVAEVLVRDGQFVQRGQPLFRLDDRADRANLERARAQLQRDQATLADLTRQWQRAQELRAQNFIAQSAADTVLATLEAQKAAVAADQASARSAEVALSYSTLQAPFGGRIGAIAVNRGSAVQPNGAALVNISRIDPIGVQFSVPESQLSALLRAAGPPAGAKAAASAPVVSISIPAPERGRQAPAEVLQGRVVFVDNAVDTATGSIRVKAEVANGSHMLWPGQYVTARLTTRTLAGAVVVPQAAVIIRGNERSIYVVKADATVEMRSVQQRLPAGEFVVVEGVQAGEKVVVEGKSNLRPGSPVKETAYVGARRGAGPASSAAGGAASGPAGPR